MEMWDHKMVFKIITWAAYGGIGASIVSTIGFIVARNTSGRVSLALLGITLSGAVIVVPYSYDKVLDRKAHPKIHDITTDTINPPAFIAIIKERKEAKKKNPKSVKNKIKYGGEKVATLQKKYHPNLTFLKSTLPADKVFKATLELINKRGWSVAAAIPTKGRIEATASTFWLGFKDDVIFRIKQEGSETRLDMRSASRIGKGDRGENARRIKAFLSKLKDKLG